MFCTVSNHLPSQKKNTSPKSYHLRLWLLIGTISFTPFQNGCNNEGFEDDSRSGVAGIQATGSTITDPSSGNLKIAREDLHQHAESFTVQDPSRSDKVKKTTRALHILWAIDSSHSMAEEIAHVEAGIKSFTKDLRKFSKIDVTMIAKAKTDQDTGPHSLKGVDTNILSEANIHHIPHVIHSYDFLTVLASYLKPTKFQDYHFFKKISQPASETFTSQNALLTHPQKNFFQKRKPLKVFIVVTDEPEVPCSIAKPDLTLESHRNLLWNADESDVQPSSVCFLNFLKHHGFRLSTYRFFAFIDNQYAKRESNAGSINDLNKLKMSNKSYHHLARELGGEVEQVKGMSRENWKSILRKLKTKLISTVNQVEFTLKFPIYQTVELKVNGEILEQNYFFVAEDKLYISSDKIKENDALEITYLSTVKS